MESNNPHENERMGFWDHVEVFRDIFIKCLAVWVVCSIGAFFFKDELFGAIFAPSQSNFVLYDLLCRLGDWIGMGQLCPESFEVQFLNTKLTSQFATHLTTSMFVGVVVALPYLTYQLFGFVSPALYDRERKYSYILIAATFVLFFLGVLLNYFLIFPLSFRFLSTYQVQSFVVNQISLDSYIDTLLMLSLLMGIVFEIPVLSYFLAKIGVIDANLMSDYRRHAFIIICVIAAVITPTADILTLLLVACPIALLYELSIWVVRRVSDSTK